MSCDGGLGRAVTIFARNQEFNHRGYGVSQGSTPFPLWLTFLCGKRRGSVELGVPVTVIQAAVAPLALLVFRNPFK
jgi:hypothetical protein